MERRELRWIGSALLVTSLAVSEAGATDLASQAINLCRAADGTEGAVRSRLLARSAAVAKAALATDDRDPRAHFAAFCALGKTLEMDGLGLSTVFTIRRVRRSIDRALELDPDYVDALVAKARLLRRLPRQWGGDRVEARRCLATALRLDPTHGAARMYAVSEGMPVTSGEHASPLGTDSR